ncbi:MAG TPA: aspartyl protease family protein [Rhizomicrobium sp.]
MMRMLGRAAGAACVATILGGAAPAATTGNAGDLPFARGDFPAARAAYEAVPAKSPNREAALRQLGLIALYENRLGEAETRLHEALALDAADTHASGALAEAERRDGKLVDVVALLKHIGRADRAAEFALFGDAHPYRIVGAPKAVTVKFERTDPLPVISLTVNGQTGDFLIDTGAAEVVLDPKFAAAGKIPVSGNSNGTFAGGNRAAVSFGRIGRMMLGSLEVDDVPAMLVPTAGFQSATGGKLVSGVIGTEFLSHFRSTLDFPAGKLVLEPRDAAPSGGAMVASTPFWQLGDHFLVAPAQLNDSPKQLFLIDSGLAGFALTAPASTLQMANIPIPPPPPSASANPQGRTPVEAFPVRHLTVGGLTENDLKGLYGAFPLPLEGMLGVHVGGVISHVFFRPYAMTFDFVRMRIEVRKSK